MIAALEQCPTLAALAPPRRLLGWCTGLFYHRDAIVGAAFGNSFEPGAKAYYFLYATKNPLESHFLPIVSAQVAIPSLETLLD
jgi:hypothetical protein